MKSDCARAPSFLFQFKKLEFTFLCVWYIIWNLLSESFGVSYICFMWSKTIFVTATIWSFDNLVLVICNFLHWKLHSTTLINNYKMMSNRYTRIFMQHGNKNYLNSLKIMALYIHWTFFDTSICCTAWTSNCRPVNIGRLNAPTQILNWKPWCSLHQLLTTSNNCLVFIKMHNNI